jgi:hypothetical protein
MWRWLARISGGLFILLLLVGIALQLPVVQTFLVRQVADAIASRTGATVAVERVMLRLPGSLSVKDVFVADQAGDTLLHAGEIRVSMRLPAWRRKHLVVRQISLHQLTASIRRLPDGSQFNYDFLFADSIPDENSAVPLDAGHTVPAGMPADAVHSAAPEASVRTGDVLQGDSPTDGQEQQAGWSFELHKLDVRQLNLAYADHTTGMDLGVDLAALTIMPAAIVPGEASYHIDQLVLESPAIRLELSEGTIEQPDTDSAAFVLPDVDIEVNSLLVNSLKMSFADLQSAASHSVQLDLGLSDLLMRQDTLELQLTKLQGLISDYPEILGAHAGIAAGRGIRLDDIYLETTHSLARVSLHSGINIFDLDMQTIGNQSVEIELRELVVGRDFASLLPDTALATAFYEQGGGIRASGSISGNVGDLDLTHLHIGLADVFDIHIQGNLSGLPDPDSLAFTIPQLEVLASAEIWKYGPVMSATTDLKGLRGPVSLKASLSGHVDDMELTARVRSELGQVLLTAALQLPARSVPSYRTRVEFRDVLAGTLLGTDLLDGGVSAVVNLQGTGFDLPSMQAAFDMMVSEAIINNYPYTKLLMEGSLSDGVIQVEGVYQDDALSLNIHQTLDLGAEMPDILTDIQIRHLDAMALQFIEEPFVISVDLLADLTLSSADFFDGTIRFDNASLQTGGQHYVLDSLVVLLQSMEAGQPPAIGHAFADQRERDDQPVRGDTTQPSYRLDLLSRIFEASYEGSITPVRLPQVLSRHMASYVDFQSMPDQSPPADDHFSFSLTALPSDWYTQVFFKELQSFEAFTLRGSFDSRSEVFQLEGQLPALVYGPTGIHGLRLHASTDPTEGNFSVGVDTLQTGGVSFQDLSLAGHVEEKVLSLSLFTEDEAGTPWLTATGNLAEMSVSFNRSDINELLAVESIGQLTGIIDGTLTVYDLQGDYSFLANLSVDHMGVNRDTIGDLSLQMSSPESLYYLFDASIRNYGNSLGARGSYRGGEASHVDAQLKVEQLDVAVFEAFTSGQLRNMEGQVSGNMHLAGNPSSLQYNGSLNLKDVGFVAGFVNVAYSMPDEHITFNRDYIRFPDLSLIDSQGRQATLAGSIRITEYSNPVFDLSLTSDNFLALRAEPGQHELYSGRVLISSDLRLRGDFMRPVVSGNLRLNEGTSFVMAIPQSVPEALGDEGIVLFLTPDSLVADGAAPARTHDPLMSSLQNTEISINVEVDPDTDVRIIIDEYAGDYLEVKGGGMISYGTDPGGRITLSGRYELTEGTYLLTFYDILSRQFRIMRGSSIVWRGDPLNPEVDIRAVYHVRTSARELFVSATGMDETGQGLRQTFPFQVNLEMKGPLMNPEIRFDIVLPPDQQQALDGRLNARINELAQNESELNKQVFALLTLGQFVPENPFASGLSGPGLSAAARSSASRLLTQQLNRLSDQYIRGVDIQFDIESYEDASDAGLQGRTQLNLELSKDFFDERLRVTVGGNIELEDESRRNTSAGDIAGDFTIEYLLDEEGRLVLKGFRKKQFDDIFEGQVIETGIALLFSRTYNRFKELFGRKEDEE